MKHLVGMNQTFPHLHSRDAIMGVAKLKKSVIDIADEQIEAKKASAKFVTVKIFFTIRPHLQPCHCEVMSLPTQARVSEVQALAWDALTGYREKVGPLLGPLPSEDPRDYMLCFFDQLSAAAVPEGPALLQSWRQQTVTSQIQSTIKTRHCSAPRSLHNMTNGSSSHAGAGGGGAGGDGGDPISSRAMMAHAVNLSLEIPSDNDEEGNTVVGDEDAIGLKDLLGLDTERSSVQPPPTKAYLQSSSGGGQQVNGPINSSRRRSSAGGDPDGLRLQATIPGAFSEHTTPMGRQGPQGSSPNQTPETGNLSARFSASPGGFQFGTAASEPGEGADEDENTREELAGVLGERILEAELVCKQQQSLASQTLSIRMCEEVPPSAVVLRVVTNRQQQLEAFKASVVPQQQSANAATATGAATSSGGNRAASADILSSTTNNKKRESTPQRRLSVSGGADGSNNNNRTPTRRASKNSIETPSNQNLVVVGPTSSSTNNNNKKIAEEERIVYDDAIPSIHLMLKPVFFQLEQTIGCESRTRAVIEDLFARSLQGIFRFATHCAEIAAKTTEKRILDAAERQQMERREYAVRKKIVRMEDGVWHENLSSFKARFKELEVGMIAQYRLITSLRERHLQEFERILKERHGGVNPYAEEMPPSSSS